MNGAIAEREESSARMERVGLAATLRHVIGIWIGGYLLTVRAIHWARARRGNAISSRAIQSEIAGWPRPTTANHMHRCHIGINKQPTATIHIGPTRGFRVH